MTLPPVTDPHAVILVPAVELDALKRLVLAAEGAREWIAHNATDGGYGFYRPPNPHDFSPDPESCSDAEIANHKAACDAYDKGEYVADKRGGWSDDGKTHVAVAPWGIGSYTYDVPELRTLLDAMDAVRKPALIDLRAAIAAAAGEQSPQPMQRISPYFANASCSQCGQDFGPGDHGFSHCQNHAGMVPR